MRLTYFLSKASKHPLTHFITWQAPGQSPLSLNIFKFKSENQYDGFFFLLKMIVACAKTDTYRSIFKISLISRIINVGRNQKYRVRCRGPIYTMLNL